MEPRDEVFRNFALLLTEKAFQDLEIFAEAPLESLAASCELLECSGVFGSSKSDAYLRRHLLQKGDLGGQFSTTEQHFQTSEGFGNLVKCCNKNKISVLKKKRC